MAPGRPTATLAGLCFHLHSACPDLRQPPYDQQIGSGERMARVQLLLSCVSAEFSSYCEALRHALTRPNVEVNVQEDFIVSGTPTLEKLDDYIQRYDWEIHLVGDKAGSMAKPESLAAMRDRYLDLASRLPTVAASLAPGGPPLSYTQWEAWLALLHRRKLFIADPAPRLSAMRPTSKTQRSTPCRKRIWLA